MFYVEKGPEGQDIDRLHSGLGNQQYTSPEVKYKDA